MHYVNGTLTYAWQVDAMRRGVRMRDSDGSHPLEMRQKIKARCKVRGNIDKCQKILTYAYIYT